MTITEANETAKVLRALGDPDEQPDDIAKAMRYLAERAAKPLLITADYLLRSRP